MKYAVYKINSKADDECEIMIYDEIGGFGITARDLISQIQNQSPRLITLRINSNGGDTFEAISIYNYLRSHAADKKVYIDGLAASAASIIAMSGDVVIMPSNAMMMIHNPWGYCQGDSEEMRDMANLLDKVSMSVMKIYESKTGLDLKEIRKLMDNETWMTADEAKTKGFADTITDLIENKTIAETSTSLEFVNVGIEKERKRLKELDELMCSGREEIIMRAKYETFKSASEVAMEIVKSETKKNEERITSRRVDGYELDEIQVGNPKSPDEEIRMSIERLNRMRGYKVS